MTTGLASLCPAWSIPGYLEVRNDHLTVNGVDTLELVNVRVSGTVPGAEVKLEVAAEATLSDRVIALPESTVYVPDGWSAEADATGTIRMTRAR